MTAGSLFAGAWSFVSVFVSSCLIGVLVAWTVALMLKYTSLHRFPTIETCLVFLMAYASYLFSNAIHQSGKRILLQKWF
jgi:sodium/hydrogen exchanger-like protein 6/7